MTCVKDKVGRLLPLTVKPYPEILEHFGMQEWEYKKAVGVLIRDKVVFVK